MTSKAVVFLCFSMLGVIISAQNKTDNFLLTHPAVPGCAKIKKEKADKIIRCNNYNIRKAVRSNLFYPREAINNQQEGTAVVEFIISKEGMISKAHIEKTSGYYPLDLAAVYGVAVMFKGETIQPATNKQGDFVNVKYTIPIIFRLDDPEKKIISDSQFRSRIKSWQLSQQYKSEEESDKITTEDLTKKFEKLKESAPR